ncbi:hypothetical protein QQX98_007439 [Neonectria punicea]|uniref:NYN domain-containing protein n=1 Tax=Neonectria punicea TaxID=979145 RepID=A0ABR1GYD4_9HYPO
MNACNRVKQIRIYIDSSNVCIQGEKAFVKHHGWVESGQILRFDAGLLKNALTQKCGLSKYEDIEAVINLYGSTHPEINTIWKAIDPRDVKVHTFKRSSWTSREKRGDAEIIAASVSDAADLHHEEVLSIFIIVSGDKDLLRGVLRIAKRGIEVHVWSWDDGLAAAYRQPEEEDCRRLKDQGLIKEHLLDKVMDKLIVEEIDFRIDRSGIPPHNSIVTLNWSQADMAILLARIPFPPRRHRMQHHGTSQDGLVIVPPCELDDRSLAEIFQSMREKLKQQGLKIMTYVDYESARLENPRGKGVDTDPSQIPGTCKDQDDEGYTVVRTHLKRQNERLKANKETLSNYCEWGKYCKFGLNCKYGHTKEETDDFNVCRKPGATKYKMCQNKVCIRGKHCRFAHGEGELFCPTCDKKGAHAMKKCPEMKMSSIQRYAS